ncbi:MAG: hypothetical protein J2P38_06910 [Candidatus Dormibacteraeota bacterium]|nr:hypothetical protein [Candidatus Dormibacteraeota bacterium]
MAISRDAVDYLEPRPGMPFDRLGILHQAMQALAGASHLAPVHHPSRIVDVGSGLHHWVREISTEFPAALTVAAGTDSPADGHPPPGVVAVRADLWRGLPFAGGVFEYVHHRAIPFVVREEVRARLVDELLRVLAPGAWIEIVLTEPVIEPLTPATELLLRQVRQLLDLSADPGAAPEPLAHLLRRRGLVDVDGRRLALPVGAWGGEVGTAMVSNFRAVMGGVASALESRLGIPSLDTLALVARCTEEIEEHRTVAPLWFVWGRRGR